MGRSGYCDDGDEPFPNASALYHANTMRSIKSKRGQEFLRELATELDSMPIKRLIPNALVSERGECCTMGVIYKKRGLDLDVDPDDAEVVSAQLGISESMAREIASVNDDDFGEIEDETPEQRWVRMRAWVAKLLTPGHDANGSPA